MLNHRIVIYAKDIERITGKSERAAHTMLHRIKEKNHKSREQVITVAELSAYLGISEAEIVAVLM